MKVRIGTFSIDFNEEAIRTAKKEASEGIVLKKTEQKQ